jgi:glycosyltransferase involved in cell wall biosynthesis
MKVLMLSNMYPSDTCPSYGTFVKAFEESLSREGVTVVKSVIKGSSKSIVKKILKYAKYFLVTYFKLAFSRYDIIYVHYAAHSLLPLSIAPFVVRKKLVINIHGGDMLPTGRLGNLILRANRKIIKHADLLVVPSTYYANLVRAKYDYSDMAIYVSPSGGIDLSLFKPASQLCSYLNFFKDTDEVTIGYVSRITEKKGWDTFLRALSLLRSECDLAFKAKIVGGGDQVEQCVRMIHDLGLSSMVSYEGPVARELLPDYFNEFDFFVFPSRKSESLGLVGLEAMACKCFVVASDFAGMKTYIEHGVNGYLFYPGSHIDLKEKLLEAIELPCAKSLAIRDAARGTTKKYETGLVAKNLIFRIKNLLNEQL